MDHFLACRACPHCAPGRQGFDTPATLYTLHRSEPLTHKLCHASWGRVVGDDPMLRLPWGKTHRLAPFVYAARYRPSDRWAPLSPPLGSSCTPARARDLAAHARRGWTPGGGVWYKM